MSAYNDYPQERRWLTAEEKAEIKRLYTEEHWTQVRIADKFGTTQSNVSAIIRGGRHAGQCNSLSKEQQEEARRLYFGDIRYTQRQLAERFGVSITTIARVLNDGYKAVRRG